MNAGTRYLSLYLHNYITKIALWHRRYTRLSQLILRLGDCPQQLVSVLNVLVFI